MANKFVDYTNGVDANDGTTFANRCKQMNTVGLTAAKITAGDNIRIMKSLDATLVGTGTLTLGGSTITALSGGANIGITTCEAAWTAAANVTCTTSTAAFTQGARSASMAVAAGFTTGIIAYFATGTLDLSTMQQINFSIQANAVIAANTIRIDLCSDAVGAVAVDSFTIDHALDPANTWNFIVRDKASALGSAIASISMVALLDPGTTTILIDGVFASKAASANDCITLHSVLSDSAAPSTLYSNWFAITYATATTITFRGYPGATTFQSLPSTYRGTTGAKNIYVSQAIPHLYRTTSDYNVIGTAGTAAARIGISGGWDTTDMSTQTGMTWVSIINCDNSGGTLRSWVASNFNDVSKIGIIGGSGGSGGLTIAADNTVTDCSFVANLGVNFSNGGGRFLRVRVSSSLYFSCGAATDNFHDDCVYHISASTAFFSNVSSTRTGHSAYAHFRRCYIGAPSGVDGGTMSPEYSFQACIFQNSPLCHSGQGTVAHLKMRNCLFEAGTPTCGSAGQIVFSQDHNQVANDDRIFGSNWRASKVTTPVDVAGGYAWRVEPLSTTAIHIYRPARMQLAGPIRVDANKLVTVTARIRRDSVSITAGIRVEGGQLAGVDSDVESFATGVANAYETVSLSFTPTAAGNFLLFTNCYGGATLNAYYDTLTITQAS